ARFKPPLRPRAPTAPKSPTRALFRRSQHWTGRRICPTTGLIEDAVADNEVMEVTSLPRAAGTVRLPPRLLAPLPDDRLVAQIRRGQDAAFEVVYDRHHRGLLSFCRHMLGSPEEAEDAVQQTFVSAYRDITGSDKP